jgi:serine/threonine-protein kinase
MVKGSDVEWDEGSAPEISVSSVIHAFPDQLANIDIVGERFGKYLLVGEIALGGMAELFLAVRKGLEGVIKAVVIKRVLPQFSTQASFVQMFIDEARLAARLEHPNIVRTYEFGEVKGQYFTAMEYLAGEDLCKVLNTLAVSRQHMPLHVAAGIAGQVCHGLHFAHQFTDTDGNPLHLVHRDINPANLVITYGGEVKVIDFGVAKSNGNAQTLTGTIKGKVSYMPPEQVLGHRVDRRADIFSTGVVLWEMLTGRPLFVRDSEAATLFAIVNASIPPPSKYRPDVPQQLDQIVARALCRSPGDRYATAEDMAIALEEFLLTVPRYGAREVDRMVEELFGSTRAEAKRAIAQTRSLTRNVSLVMKLRREVRADLAERLDASAVAHGAIATTTGRHGRLEPEELGAGADGLEGPITAGAIVPARRGAAVALGGIMVGCIAAGLIYTTVRSGHDAVATPIVQAALQVDTTPPGAAIFIEGEPTGLTTPATLTGITRDVLSLRLELAGYEAVTGRVEPVPGVTTTRHFTLTALPSRIVIAGLPPGASVLVDGEQHAPGEAITMVAGRHIVRVVIDHRTIAQQEIDTMGGDHGWRLFQGKLIPN